MRQRNPFLKSVGLEIPFLFGYGKGQGEAPKLVIDTNRLLALSRCGVHILPILVCILIISLNCKHEYLGRTLPGSIMDPSINIALLQIAAKLQELAIVASLSTIVIHVLRSEMINGEGIPLGLLGGGFMFTGFSYFWSPEFWGSTYLKYTWTARLKVYGVLILAGIIASFAGPSTAVLLIPEDQIWSVGDTYIYPPGTQDEWSPTLLSAETHDSEVDCSTYNATSILACPSGGFPALWAARDSLNIYKTVTWAPDQARNITLGLNYGNVAVNVPSSMSLLPEFQIATVFRSIACETSTSSPRIMESMYSSALMIDWQREAYAIPYEPFKYGPTLTEYKYHGMIKLNVDSVVPSLRVICAPAQDIGSQQQTLAFPNLPDDGCWTTAQNPTSEAPIPSLSLPTTQIQSGWLSLPSHFGSISAGFVLQLPSDNQDSTRSIITCSIDARWINGSVKTILPYYADGSSYKDSTFGSMISTALLKTTDSDHFGRPDFARFLPVMKSTLSSRMTLSRTWLSQLTPVLPPADQPNADSNLTTLEALLIDIGLFTGLQSDTQTAADIWNTGTPGMVNRTVALEWWLAVFLTDGLARRGSLQALNTTGPVETWSLLNYDKQADFGKKILAGKAAIVQPTSIALKKKVSIDIGGYSYQANSITDWAAIVLLTIYVLLAVSHSVYCISTGRTSGAWDTLTELLILVQNSSKASRTLRNTNAGVKDILTYSRRARIFSTTTGTGTTESINNVELIFDEESTPQHGSITNLNDPGVWTSTVPVPIPRYNDNRPHHDRSLSRGRSDSRSDYKLTTSDISQVELLERLRSYSGGSDTYGSGTSAIQRRPLLGKIRPGIAYGHSTIVVPTNRSRHKSYRQGWFSHRPGGASESQDLLL